MDPARRARVRRSIWSAVKVVAAGACVAYVLRRANFGELASGLARIGQATLALLLALTVLQLLALGQRWRSALVQLGERVSFLPLVGDVLVGAAYNTILPSTVGGDVTRAYRCATRVKHPPSAVASIALERVIAFLCLATVPFGGLLLDHRDAPGIFVAISLVSAVSFGLLLVFLHLPFELFGAALAPIHRGAAAFVKETAADVRNVHTRSRLVIAGWAFLYLGLVMASFFAVARSWADPAPPRALLIGIPVAIILSAVPVTIGGLGLRESLFVAILGRLGVSGAQALSLSLVWGAEWLLLAVLGALVLAATRVSRPTP